MPVALHPDPARLTAFARGALPPDDLASVADHVADCPSCCDALARASGDSLAELARAAAGGNLDATPAPKLPTDPPYHSTQANTVGTAPAPLPRLPVSPEVALADHPRYKILAELGAGGMGVVYKAEHRLMGRVVALKVVSPHLTAKKNTVERFRREVQAAAKLSHANIVAAHDAEEAAGLHFLVMEYVDGISLDRLVAKKGALPVAMACQFIRHAAQGLQHASDQGMVHRDIKPQNIMVTRKGQVKVLDFGLARFARSAPEGEAVTEVGGAPLPQDAGLTQPNHVMGTPDYLSPEQARSSAVDIRSDIYSLGCTLYFLLAGRVPFPDGQSLFDKLIAHTNDTATPIQSLRPDVPDGLARILARMMAKKADDRYQTPAEVAAALHPYAKGLDTKGAKPAPADEVVEAVLVAPSPSAEPVPVPAESPFREFAEVAAETPSELETPRPTVNIRRPRRGYRRRRRESEAWKLWVALGVGFLALLAIALGVRAVMKPKTVAEATGRAADTEPDRRPARPTGPTTRPAPPPPTAPDADPPQPENPFRPGVPTIPMPRDPQTPDPPQRVVLVVLPSHDRAPDFTPLRQRLTEMGAKVETATGTGEMPAPGAAFLPIEATYQLRPGMDYTRFAAVVFCAADVTEEYALPPPPKGGPKGKKDFGGPRPPPPQVEGAREAIQHAMTKYKPLAALGPGGAHVLNANGVLTGRRVPAMPNLPRTTLTEEKPVVADLRNDMPVIVGVGESGDNAAAFADAVLKAMNKNK